MSEEVRRARIIAGAALMTVALLVLVILVSTGGGDDGPPRGTLQSAATKPAATTTTKKQAPAKKKAAPAKPAAGALTAAQLGPNPLKGTEARAAAVPVLVWRVIAPPPAGSPRPQLYTPPEVFDAQLTALADQGYRPITLSRLFAAWDSGAPIPRQSVVLAFDDGYPSQGRVAGPALKKRGWPGVLNLIPGNVGGDGLPRSRLQELVAAGWEVDVKAAEVPEGAAGDPTAQTAQLRLAGTQVRDLVKKEPAAFAYPQNRFGADIKAAVEAAGYKGSQTDEPGLAKPEDRFALRRIDAQRTGADPQALLSQIRSYAGAAAPAQ